MKTGRILLIDDHPMFRSGLRMLLDAEIPGSEIYEASSIDGVYDIAPEHLDVVLLDIQMKGLSGLEGIALLKRKWPLAHILMLSSQDEPETVLIALARGAYGFVSKAETAETIVGIVQNILRGKTAGLPLDAKNTSTHHLTPRQAEVLGLLHQGFSNKLVARQLSLSDNTVRRHVQDILEYFQVTNRAEAVFAARQQGLLR